LAPILFSVQGEHLTKEAFEGFGDFKRGGQVIRTVKYGEDLKREQAEETPRLVD
jgi:hypothetical protein